MSPNSKKLPVQRAATNLKGARESGSLEKATKSRLDKNEENNNNFCSLLPETRRCRSGIVLYAEHANNGAPQNAIEETISAISPIVWSKGFSWRISLQQNGLGK
jgi:hypothetical protein